VNARTRILEAAAELLENSAEADFSTRAVCEAAGVAAPALYRQFGDKEGLLSAVVDFGFDKYLASKRAARPSADPVADLRSGWDTHVAFALANRNVYRLMWSPVLATLPDSAAEAHRLLHEVLVRCAEAGRLAVSPELAARMIMSANIGVSLALVARPEQYPDLEFADRVREALYAAILVDAPTGVAPGAATTAATLGAQLAADPPAHLTPAEQGLLSEWLTRLANGNQPA
jgi:AcrR family transcriptional regulator